jgi:hypothetical protein
VPPQAVEQLADGAVVRDGVADGLDGLEPKDALVVALHDAALRGPALVAPLVLHVIVPAAVRLPNVDLDAPDGPAVRVADHAYAQHGLALGVRRHGAAVGHGGGVVRVEGTQHRALGRRRRLGVVDAVDEQREAEDVGEEDEFLQARRESMSANRSCLSVYLGRKYERAVGGLAPWTTYMANVAADLTTRHQKVECCHPFLGAKSGLSGKVMEMRHEARHEVLEPRIFALGVDQISVWGDVVDREI